MTVRWTKMSKLYNTNYDKKCSDFGKKSNSVFLLQSKNYDWKISTNSDKKEKIIQSDNVITWYFTFQISWHVAFSTLPRPLLMKFSFQVCCNCSIPSCFCTFVGFHLFLYSEVNSSLNSKMKTIKKSCNSAFWFSN